MTVLCQPFDDRAEAKEFALKLHRKFGWETQASTAPDNLPVVIVWGTRETRFTHNAAAVLVALDYLQAQGYFSRITNISDHNVLLCYGKLSIKRSMKNYVDFSQESPTQTQMEDTTNGE